MIDFL
jgi:adiponectin receptor